MSKVISISPDDIAAYDTLPGSTGSMTRNGASVSDTIFGQSFQSTQPTLLDWGLQANSYYKGYAGYKATVKKTGTPTATTGEAFSLVSGKTYQIDDTTRQLWDRTATVTVYDNAVAVADADIESIDYLFGKVAFAAGYTVTGPITADVSYFTTSDIGGAMNFDLTQTAETKAKTDYANAKTNNGYRSFDPGLRTVALSLSGFYDGTNGLMALLEGRSEVIVEIDPVGTGKSICRGFFKLTSDSLSGDVGATEEDSVEFTLTVPENVATPFAWEHAADTDIPAAIKTALDAWEAQTKPYMQYLPDGLTGWKGQGVITSASLSGDLEGINEFSVQLAGSGQPTTV